MYLVYVRPLFEYACEVWDVIIFSKYSFHFAFWERITPKCLWLVDKGILLPLKVNSMLSMLPILEKNKISVFSGLETLSERRYRRKLQLFFNIKCGMAPEYLRHLVPPNIQSTTIYPFKKRGRM
jgi:hypothetical protein